MKHILIVDDESRIRELIREHLEAHGYQVTEAADGMAALALFRENPKAYAAMILDVMMPELDGWSLCREIRRHSEVPVIMLTARGEEYDKLFGFELGVDDYLVKPFSPKELMARLKAVLRRSETDGDSTGTKKDRWRFQGLAIDLPARRVTINDAPVKLTPREYELLVFLAQHPGQAFSREQLLNQVWGYDFEGEDRTVDTHIKMLRENLKPYKNLIVTVWGHGYKFEAEEGP
ncbi:response regulator transcription factor [Anoxynatronum buryatiense]|uniref:Stage 0 sporulation protein A homolog n=1 Tax=Anoxynatronum buryatiense TaxID=489973 RepID=A0AA45WXM8_9CLOT|nr:response regulator transcription factor [Anoxynatronum buryatiense]SMP64902.1 two component transcriptional regulator, winged helix family [Anoxynatronum buryatiense]